MQKILFIGRKNCEYTNKALIKLQKFNWKVITFFSEKRDTNLPKKILFWKGDYIFSFRSYVILPKKVLINAKKAAINFHPSTSKYRGSGGINIALYNNDKYFGCTAHLMTDKIDAGKIILNKKFKIYKKDNINSLLNRTHKELLNLFNNITFGIYKYDLEFLESSILKSKKEKWGKKIYKIKDIDELQKININITKNKLYKVIRSTHTKNFPVYIYCHGAKFILKNYI